MAQKNKLTKLSEILYSAFDGKPQLAQEFSNLLGLRISPGAETPERVPSKRELKEKAKQHFNRQFVRSFIKQKISENV